ncbi:GNAT family N-acetyltransferase [Streptomyces sp. NPDC093260]|uniref:GNAT family N-acetyltransferase n=1 Tax=Streptomyces sp. NPDC093260 TaxID=3155073 RepID=UPI003413065B
MKRTADGAAAPDTAGTVVHRVARPEDGEAIAGIDTSFTTDSVFEVTVTGGGFRVVETRVEHPVHKVFPADDGGEDDQGGPGPDRTVVALDGDEVCGFVTVSFAPWNRRLTVRDIAVAPAWRGRGVGRTLLRHAVDFAKECGAVHVWLEVSNVNAPAVHAYLRAGFVLCGLDTTLYEGTESAGEVALFMSRRVD